MRWALVMIRLCAACRNTSVSRTTGTAPDEMMSASTWPGPTEGSWSMSPTINREALSGTALKSACISMTSTMEASSTTSRSQSSGLSSPPPEATPLRVNVQQSMDCLGLEAGRLGHALGRAASRRTQQKGCALRCEDAQDRLDDGGFADAGPAGHDQHLGHQRESDCRDLAVREGKADALLDPRQGFVGIDRRPRQRVICQTH